jgi:hypothetical protein
VDRLAERRAQIAHAVGREHQPGQQPDSAAKPPRIAELLDGSHLAGKRAGGHEQGESGHDDLANNFHGYASQH